MARMLIKKQVLLCLTSQALRQKKLLPFWETSMESQCEVVTIVQDWHIKLSEHGIGAASGSALDLLTQKYTWKNLQMLYGKFHVDKSRKRR